jgi:hypothetical protein
MQPGRILIALAVLAVPRGVPAQQQPIPIVGHWNLRALVGRFVGLIGGARLIPSVEWADGVGRFTIPSERDTSGDLRFEVRAGGHARRLRVAA